MHIHILGICGTFMAGIAILAKQQGHEVSGCDENVYPPMSTQLAAQGIVLQQGFDPKCFDSKPDQVVVGNAMKRGNPAIEYMLNNNLPYISGPQWLSEQILKDRWVLAVAGTHGKTTTSSMLAWILEYANLKPVFLIGGIPQNFGISARLGEQPFFVIEADEYDTAFFDKRSKFIHYQPRTAILNNLEFDHADIFSNIEDIKTQFHHLVRIVPGNGLIVCAGNDKNLADTLQKGCWTPVEYIDTENATWQAKDVTADGSEFSVYYNNQKQGVLQWDLLGQHNVHNALAAIAAAQHAGVKAEHSIAALAEFKNVKRRMEKIGQLNGATIYDDFAHHPTAIATTLQGLREKVKSERIIAVLELGSYTMRSGVHRADLAPSLKEADEIIFARPKEDWGIDGLAKEVSAPAQVCENVDDIIVNLKKIIKANDHIVIMSNKGFDGLHQKLLES
jgi:UDP-N-acetylmuramate: L-alanyl-gamma-D-glutamyl-meso-diaminopimelate ligase